MFYQPKDIQEALKLKAELKEQGAFLAGGNFEEWRVVDWETLGSRISAHEPRVKPANSIPVTSVG